MFTTNISCNFIKDVDDNIYLKYVTICLLDSSYTVLSCHETTERFDPDEFEAELKKMMSDKYYKMIYLPLAVGESWSFDIVEA